MEGSFLNARGRTASVDLSFLSFVVGTCCTEHLPDQLKQLGLDHQRAIKLACKLHAHSVMYANKLVTTRRAIQNDVVYKVYKGKRPQ
eukprot:1139045-Pelagomonas_calceolata.AAC.2